MVEIANEHPEAWVRYHRGFESLYNRLDDGPDEREMDVVLFFGDAGTGKSTKARSYAKLYGKYYSLGISSGGNLWFDGYNGEATILIDEFKGWIDPRTLNKILDIYKERFNVKGSTILGKWNHVFITSNYPPEEWWKQEVVWERAALLRRIHHIYEFRGTDHVDCVIKKLK